MQGDYFAYNNQVYPGYTPYACAPYTQQAMPAYHRTIENLKKTKSKSMSASRNFNDYGSHSTDESIHLVRSRKSRDDRYEANQMLKKRSQSGTSIMKGMASQLSVPRSHSDDRSISPSLLNIEKRKARKSKNNKPTFSQLEDGDEESFTYSGGGDNGGNQRLVEQSYFNNELQQQQPHYHQNQFGYPQMNQYGQYQQYLQDPYQLQQQFYQQTQQQQPQQQQQHSYQPPGAPADFYQNSNTRNFNNQSGNGSQSYYQQADMYSNGSNGTQTYLPDQQTQGLPNGAKIVAEYFLGYLDEQQNNYTSSQPKPIQQEQGECAPQMQYYQQPQQQQQMQMQYQAPPVAPQPQQQQFQFYQQPQQSYAPACPVGCEPGVACPPGCEPVVDSSSGSEKEEVDIEIWEKPSRKKKNKRSQDDLRKLTDIIDALEKKLGNLNVNNSGGGGDPIQPIFLMPKQPEQAAAKPIYVPRNIYVPVIRPVFVPRERIIIRPQIIHVARPVLVDRPVPIQQRPLIIERDRPVPVRVETIERTEAVPFENGEPCVEKEGKTETTYHEFAQPHRSSSVGDFAGRHNMDSDAHYENVETNSNSKSSKQLVLDLLAEAERRKQNLESQSNDSFNGSQRWKQIPEETTHQTTAMSSSGTYQPSAIPFNSGYTLEVLDQRVSDRFEKVDEETIKQRYGVESFQYLPTTESNVGTLRSSGGSFKSLASNLENNESVYGNQSTNGNLTSILTDLANLANK